MSVFMFTSHTLDLTARVAVMGIINATPDSFSGDGINYTPEAALESALAMIDAGADIIDIGGESTRPGAAPVSAVEELDRVLPVVRLLRAAVTIPISIDTTKAEVARVCLEHGADIVNDISGMRRDAGMADVIAASDAGGIAMHMRGTPQTMQNLTGYDDLIGEIHAWFCDTLAMLEGAGIAPERICLDPGIGFSKTADQNLILLRRLNAFLDLNRPLLVGASRKSFIGRTLGIEAPEQRTWGTAAAVACAVMNGARIVRVHDVAAMRQVANMSCAIAGAGTQDAERRLQPENKHS